MLDFIVSEVLSQSLIHVQDVFVLCCARQNTRTGQRQAFAVFSSLCCAMRSGVVMTDNTNLHSKVSLGCFGNEPVGKFPLLL